jgi:hypothetical protein
LSTSSCRKLRSKDKTETDTSHSDFAALRKQAEGLILQLAKGGYRAEAVAILEKQGAKNSAKLLTRTSQT